MNLSELNKVATAMVAPGRGILAADESSGTIKKRFDALGVESTADTRRDYREMLFRSTEAMSKNISGVILYDETIRQNAKDGTPLVKLIEKAGALPGIKVDKGTQAAAVLSRRNHHRRARRPARTADRIPQPRRQIRQVARRDRYRRGHSELQRHHDQCACAGALRRALPGRRHRADRRAGSADGRRSRHRPLRRGQRMDAQDGVRAALLSARRARRHGAQAQHGGARQEVAEAGFGRRSRRQDLARAQGLRAGLGARHRVSVRRPVRRRRHRPSRRHQQDAATCPGTSPSPTAAPCSTRRRPPGAASRKTSPRRSAPSTTAP